MSKNKVISINQKLKLYFSSIKAFKILNHIIFKNGGLLIFIGGAIRSLITGSKIKDYDAEVYMIDYQKLYNVLEDFSKIINSKIIYVGAKFGVFKIISLNLDISLPRTETSTGLGHQDFLIKLHNNIDYCTASMRRDFKINTIGYCLIYNHVLDPHNGLIDIKNKIISIVDDENRFLEDPLRILRAIYFSNKLNFRLDNRLINLIKNYSYLLVNISIERIAIEINKTLRSQSLEYIQYISLINCINIEFIEAIKSITCDNIGITLIQNLNTFQERVFFILINHFNQEIINFLKKMQNHKENNIMEIIIVAGIYYYNYVEKNNKLLNIYLKKIKQHKVYINIINFIKEKLNHQFIYKYSFKVIKFIHVYILNIKSFNNRQIWKKFQK